MHLLPNTSLAALPLSYVRIFDCTPSLLFLNLSESVYSSAFAFTV